ncbi:MAG: BlaI/MecI/CopY family transcriptional regulator [Alistipes sp.]|nr:BlaI/MecI/CopY family transcriptional regulator [Alistipes sp.]
MVAKTLELTRAELEIMQILWKIEKGFVNDILEAMPEPKPAYNTVSTIVRILEKKEFVSHTAFGKSHQYYPIIDHKTYTKGFMASVLENFFGGSIGNMVNFLSDDKQISANEADEIIKMLTQNK